MAGSGQVVEHAGSYYAASANPAPARPPLTGDARADACVVGAGYSGLSAALHLAEQGYRVIVLEAARVGWGASGRNGGQLVNGFSRGLDVIEARYGADAAGAIGRMVMAGGDLIRERARRYQIACDLKPTNLFTAYTRKQMAEFEAKIALWRRHGIESLELLDRDALQHHVVSPGYLGGLIDHRGGHLHPLNLALGEAAAVESLGGVIHEQTPVLGIDHDAHGAVARTTGGSVRAPALILCGNAYLGDAIPALAGRVMPVSTQIIATAPLGEARARALIPSDTCVEDANYILDYFRFSADHRLLFGGGTTYGGAEPADIIAKLRPNLKAVFPSLDDVGIDYAWSGNFALTLTRIPDLGRLGRHVYFAHGYSGHGVTGAHLAGQLIAEAVQGDAARFDVFANLPYYAFPGGRLFRVPISVLGSWWYGLRDRLGA